MSEKAINEKNEQHVILLGDSIFDNAPYVPVGRHVTRHLRERLGAGNRVTRCAVDGSTSRDIPAQMKRIPSDATHLFLSVGGNDGLYWRDALLSAGTPLDVLTTLREAQKQFAASYGRALALLVATGLPVWACTVYKHVPGLADVLQAPLGVFNDVITETVHRSGTAGLIDLRTICTEAADYSEISPIEPSDRGGQKIADAIAAAFRAG